MGRKNLKSFWLLIYTIIVPLTFVNCSTRSILQIDVVSNGGKKTETKEFVNEKRFFESFLPGETLVYWKDNLLYLDFGPNYANEVNTKVSADLITEVRFFDLDSQSWKTAFELGLTEQHLSTDIERFRLSSFVSSNELLKYLENSSAAFSNSLMEVIYLFSQIKAISLIETEKMTSDKALAWLLSENTIGDLFDFLLNNKLINSEQLFKLNQYIKKNGLDLDTLLGNLYELLKITDLKISINAYYLVKLLQKYNLSVNFSLASLQSLFDNANVDIDISADGLRNLFGNLGLNIVTSEAELGRFLESVSLMSRIDDSLLEYGLIVGKPEIVLTKKSSQEKIYYDLIYEYFITYKNYGDMTASNVFIIDSLPIGVKVISSKVDNHKYSTKIIQKKENQVVYWEFKEDLKKGDYGTIYIKVLFEG